MAVRAHHLTLSSSIRDPGPRNLSQKSFALELSTSSWTAENSVSANFKSRILIPNLSTRGAELSCSSVSRRLELFCVDRNHGGHSRILRWWRIRAEGLDFGRRNKGHSVFRSPTLSSRCTHSLSSWAEFPNPARKRISAGGRRRMQVRVRAAAVDDPYEILGVSRSATEKDIKQAYRKLALKFHPDVNKEADAQKKFLQIKAAYQTLVDEKSRAKYDSSTRASPQWDPFTWETERPFSEKAKEEEEFYGLGDFFRDVQISIEDFFRDLQADVSKKEKQDAKPKSLWEELAEIGEEFVEFLEKELNIADSNDGDKSSKYRSDYDSWDRKKKQSDEPNIPEEEKEKKKVESDIAEIEEMLAKIKKELGI